MGLTVMPKRRVYYGNINPREAREIFIRAALVAGEYATQAPFFEHNRKLIADVAALEHKARRPDVLVDEERQFSTFYDDIVPEGIAMARRLKNGAGRPSGKTPACSTLPATT